MDPGYNEANLKLLKENAEKLEIPIIIEKSEIFAITEKQTENPCYLCARMRRGFLYKAAQDLGCNKIALGHHMNDVIETTMLNILYAGCFKTMMPKLKSKNFEGMEVIRPMYYIKEKDIITYMKYSEIETMQCGCRIASRDLDSKREEVKQLIKKLKKTNPVIEKHIFKTALNVNLDCVIEWEYNNKKYNFMDFYSESKKSDDD
jgi:tRNA(Ile)-lysidine synthase TilS/MesJ